MADKPKGCPTREDVRKQLQALFDQARSIAGTDQDRLAVNQNERLQFRKLGLIEQVTNQSMEEGGLPVNSAGWVPKYVEAIPTEIPPEQVVNIQDNDARIKSEHPEQPAPRCNAPPGKCSADGPCCAPSNKWFRVSSGGFTNTMLHDSNGSMVQRQQDARNPDESIPDPFQSQIERQEQEERDKAQKRRRRNKLPLSKEFLEVSTSSATEEKCDDNDPYSAGKVFKLFLMKPNRRSAFIAEVSRLDPKRGGIIFGDDTTDHARQKRTTYVERLKKSLEKSLDSTPGDLFMQSFLGLLVKNPESFFHILHLCKALNDRGVSEPEEIEKRITYSHDLGKAVIVDTSDDIAEETLSDEDRTLIESFDSRVPCAALTNTLMAGFPDTGPSAVSTPKPGRTAQEQDNSFNASLIGTEHILSVSDKEEREYLARYGYAQQMLAKITSFPIQGRVKIGKVKELIETKCILPPLPIDYHPRYADNPRFLMGSFSGETLPGVFRPCSSNWTEDKAKSEYLKENKASPLTLKELNSWVKGKFPPHDIPFDASRHCIEVKGYEMAFFREIDSYELAKTGAGLRSPGEHVPRNMVTAQEFLNLHSEVLGKVQPYIANPLLSTLGPSFATRMRYSGYSIHMPRYKGSLVMKTALFDYNNLSYGIVNNQSQIGRCAVCGGFLALPDYVTFLAFFWPDELEPHQVTGRIKDVWKQQKINVCFIHALTDGVRIPERMISLSLNTNPPS